MNPCPFCGDARPPEPDEYDPDDGQPPIHVMLCQCCGAAGPVGVSKEAALKLWNIRFQPGHSASWRKFFRTDTTDISDA